MILPLNHLKPVSTSLVSFKKDSIEVEGEITLSVIARTTPWQSTVFMIFTVVRLPLAYNIILEWSGLNQLDNSTKCHLIHFPTRNIIGEMHRNQ